MSYSNAVPPPGAPRPGAPPQPLISRPACRHCQRRQGAPDRRGLCWACHRDPDVRDLYPADPGKRHRGAHPDANRNAPPPEEPTDAPPGSEAKVRVLIERARQRRALWHPDDAPMSPADAPADLGAFGSVLAGRLAARERAFRYRTNRRANHIVEPECGDPREIVVHSSSMCREPWE